MSLDEKLIELESDVKEMKSLLETAVRAKVKDMLSINIRKLETDLIHLKEEERRLSFDVSGSDRERATAKPAATNVIPDSQIKDYSWDQSERFVKLYLTNLPGLSDLNEDAVKTQFSDEGIEIRIENYKSKNLVFSINKTCHKINPEKCYHKIKSDYLLVFLCKHNPGSSWSHFTNADKMKSESSKLKPDSKVDSATDPSAGLMDMMKKMYDEGDDDMKRTIAKAWTEGQNKKMDI